MTPDSVIKMTDGRGQEIELMDELNYQMHELIHNDLMSALDMNMEQLLSCSAAAVNDDEEEEQRPMNRQEELLDELNRELHELLELDLLNQLKTNVNGLLFCFLDDEIEAAMNGKTKCFHNRQRLRSSCSLGVQLSAELQRRQHKDQQVSDAAC